MAGAYVVFLALIVVYVAIIGAKIARIEREISELTSCGGRRVTGELLALGVSHKTAPLALRERLALPEGRAARVLAELVATTPSTRPWPSPPATAPSSTSSPPTPWRPRTPRSASLSRQAGIRPTELLGALYSLRGAEAVAHLFEVAAGLDSMIVGEAEIQGQVKRAYELALVEGVTGPVTNRLFRDALARRQARAHRDRVGALERVRVLGGRGARGRLPRRPRRRAACS